MLFNKCFPCLQFRNEESVKKLDCSNTVLTDVFPDVWQYEELEELYLTTTRINTLPPQLFYCQSLRVLVVNNNNLETIPNAIGSLRQLQHFNISRNLISNVPDNIKSCKNLTRLDLSYNNLQRLPDAITCLISLQELLLNETYLEFLPANFGRLVHLRILELRLNNLMTLPKSIARLSNLQRLDIGGNEFTSLPDVIGELKQLRELWFDYNQIREITPNIGRLRELQHLEANGNLIDALPNEISNWRNVEVISICANNLLTFPFSIGMLKTVVTLKCETNELQDLPDSISNLENLEELVLSHNQLSRLPSTIGMLKKLRFIFVDDNKLRELPIEICNCSNLSVLSVSRNKLTALPVNIGHLRKLKVLNIVNNCISTLPVSILGLVNLTSLWINDNQSQPLVPLQYSDIHTKNELTCFMLPQQGDHIRSTQRQQQNKNVNFTEQQEQKIENYSLNGCPNLYSKRICFADQPTVVNIIPSHSDKIIDSIDTNSVEADELGVRLMRSPTPYPKELRLMAKYVRQSKQKPSQASLDYKLMDTKEANVMANKNMEKSHCDTRDILENSKSQSQIGINCDSNKILRNMDDSNPNLIEHYHYQAQIPVSPQLHRHLEVEQIERNQIHQINANLESDHSYMQEQYFYPLLHSNTYNNYEMKDSPSNTQITIPTNILNGSNAHTMEPPPYHIARIFTKKSPKDLTSYEAMRNLHQKACLPNGSEIDNIESFVNQNIPNEILNTDVLHTALHDSMNPITFCDNQNISNTISSMQNLVASNSVDHNYEMQHLILDRSQHQLNRTISPMFTSNTSINNSNSNTNTLDRVNNKKTPWLFGVHKNPTVKQVVLKWEDHIGFHIESIDNKEGIYVSSMYENSPASRVLCINDKLLEVDGCDFTNITLTQARLILQKSGPVINIMLSRK